MYQSHSWTRIQVLKSKWNIPQKVAENNRAKLLWDLQTQTETGYDETTRYCGDRQNTEEGSSDRCSHSKFKVKVFFIIPSGVICCIASRN